MPNGPSVARDGQGRNMLGLPRRRTHEALSLEDRKESEDFMKEGRMEFMRRIFMRNLQLEINVKL